MTTPVSAYSDFCKDPVVPDHAIRTPPKGAGVFYVGAKVHYTCEDGYKMRGSPVLKCLEGGAWYGDGGFPTCTGKWDITLAMSEHS